MQRIARPAGHAPLKGVTNYENDSNGNKVYAGKGTYSNMTGCEDPNSNVGQTDSQLKKGKVNP